MVQERSFTWPAHENVRIANVGSKPVGAVGVPIDETLYGKLGALRMPDGTVIITPAELPAFRGLGNGMYLKVTADKAYSWRLITPASSYNDSDPDNMTPEKVAKIGLANEDTDATCRYIKVILYPSADGTVLPGYDPAYPATTGTPLDPADQIDYVLELEGGNN